MANLPFVNEKVLGCNIKYLWNTLGLFFFPCLTNISLYFQLQALSLRNKQVTLFSYSDTISMCEGEEKGIQAFGAKTWGKKTTWKTQT